MKCPACGTRNNFYHRYCYFCGEKLGAMIDPPDQYDRSADLEEASARDTSFSEYDDHDTISGQSGYSMRYEDKEDYSKESYFTQENTSVDIHEDFFGYPAGESAAPSGVPGRDDTSDEDESRQDDIDYFGYPSAPHTGPARHDREDTAAGEPEDDYASAGSRHPEDRNAPDTAGPAGDPVSSTEGDIAAKISYMEKYMDAYLSGRIGHDQDGVVANHDDTAVYNDSLDFIHIEEEETAQPEPGPEQRPAFKPEQSPAPRPEQMPAPRPEQVPAPRPEQVSAPRPEQVPAPRPEQRYPRPHPPSAPPPPAPTDADADAGPEEYDLYEDEETSRMIDMLYQGEPSRRDSSYPRRSHRHAPVNDAEEAVEEPGNADGNIVVKIMIALVIIALMGFAGFVLWNEFLNPNKVPAESNMDLIVTHTLDIDTLEDGTPGQRLTLYAPGADSATIFGETYFVEDNKVQQFYSDDFLLQQYQAAGDAAMNNEFSAIATVFDADGKSIEYEIKFTLSSPVVQLGVFSPEGDTIEVQGDTYALEISLQSGARLYVNDTEYTDRVGPDGLAVIEIDVPGTEEKIVHIRASMEGYADANKTITLIPAETAMTESLLTINESIPIAATGTDVVLTGQVPSGATIETSLPQSVSPAVTDGGAFSVTVQIPTRPGYSVCVVRVMLDGTQVDQQEVIIDKMATFNEYTTGPWEFSPYESYKNDPALHEGYRFKIPGTVKDIVSQGDGLTVCTVDVNPNGTEQLIRVWFWGDFSHTAGGSVTVYGNRWGNEEGVPRILAKYIVSD